MSRSQVIQSIQETVLPQTGWRRTALWLAALIQIAAACSFAQIAGLSQAANDATDLSVNSLRIEVIEGDGMSYATGSRATRGLTVLVTDHSGRPVEGALVSFVLPNDGPGGLFASGTRTEIISTHADGRATAWGMRWNRLAGVVEVRIAAVKGSAKAIVSARQYLIDPTDAEAMSELAAAGGGRGGAAGGGGSGMHSGGHKWLWVALAAGGAAAAGAGLAGRSSTSSTPTPAANTGTVQIGPPTITLSSLQ